MGSYEVSSITIRRVISEAGTEQVLLEFSEGLPMIEAAGLLGMGQILLPSFFDVHPIVDEDDE